MKYVLRPRHRMWWRWRWSDRGWYYMTWGGSTKEWNLMKWLREVLK